MIYRLTNKMAKRIKESSLPSIEHSANPYLDWAADVFVANRVHYILLTHCRSLLSCVAVAKGINNSAAFIERCNEMIRDTLLDYDYEFIFRSHIAPEMGKIAFSKVASRKVNGVMVDLVKHAKYYAKVDELSPYELTQRLNRFPHCKQEHPWPVEAFAKLQINRTGGSRQSK